MNESLRETKLISAFVKLAGTLTADFDVVDLLQLLVESCAEILDTEAAGILLLDGHGQLQMVASTSDEARIVEVMQLNAGEGPCVECFSTGKPITVGDIEELAGVWPKFHSEALSHGFKSVHAAPLRLRGQVLGALNLFGTQVGKLGADDIAVAQALADVATIGVLQERGTRETQALAGQLQHALNSRVLIEQAKGVVSESSSLTMNEAFAVIRQYARSNNLPLTEVATSLIERTLSLSSAALT